SYRYVDLTDLQSFPTRRSSDLITSKKLRATCFRERILRRLPSNDLNEMPDEPNRNVEDELKAWAQKRRDEAYAPFELHPATRKMLQDEVARTFPKKSDLAADIGRQATLGEPNHPSPYVG